MYLFLGIWQGAFVLSAMISAIMLLHFMKSHRWGHDYKLYECRLSIKTTRTDQVGVGVGGGGGGGIGRIEGAAPEISLDWVRVLTINVTKYSRRSPFEHSRKRPALVTTTFAKHLFELWLILCNEKHWTVSYRDHFWDCPTGLFLCFQALLVSDHKLWVYWTASKSSDVDSFLQ